MNLTSKWRNLRSLCPTMRTSETVLANEHRKKSKTEKAWYVRHPYYSFIVNNMKQETDIKALGIQLENLKAQKEQVRQTLGTENSYSQGI